MSSDNRLETVETKLAYLEQTVETLNQTVTEQWHVIDRLKRQIGDLTSRLQDAEARAESGAAPEPPPPHY